TTERSVGGPATAAIFIESWLRTDIARPLLAARGLPPASAAASGRAADARMPTLTASFETSFTGSLWAGASVAACLPAGPLCTGLLLRLAGETAGAPAASYNRTPTGDLKRVGADALLVVDWPIGAGKVTVIPGLAAGATWLVTHAAYLDRDGGVARPGFAADARVTLSLPLTRSVARGLGLSAAIAPLAHRESFSQHGFVIPGNPLGHLRCG